MNLSWISLYPEWYRHERRRLQRHYPDFHINQYHLQNGLLMAYGELVIRPPGGAQRYPVVLLYPQAFPFEPPEVIPLICLPASSGDGGVSGKLQPRLFDHRHQMADGKLCLFQRETRLTPGGDAFSCVDVLRRAEQWFIGHSTGHWPPDTLDSELESHFHQISDVLVVDKFYDTEVSGHGRLFFATDMRRYWLDRMMGQADFTPIVLVALTEEATIIKPPRDAREELSRLYPWIEDKAWDPSWLIRATDLSTAEDSCLEHGYWWGLTGEPPPFHDGTGFLRTLATVARQGEDPWDMLTSVMGGDLSTARKHFLGLRFPSRRGGVEWLIVGLPRKRPAGTHVLKTPAEQRRDFEQSPVFAFRIHRLSRCELTRRNTGVVDKSVHDRSVSLIGLGALGSAVAELLAKAGVGRFRLCDSDVLMIGNVARHSAGVSEFGAKKTRVVASRLLEINPFLSFAKRDILEASAVASLGKLADFIGDTDLTVCTTADESVESTVNEIAVISRKTVVYGRSLRRANMARVFLVRPGRDPCKACLSEYMSSGRDGRPVPTEWIDVREDDAGVILHECGRPVIASSAIDLSFAASLIARVALSYLEGKVGAENHWVWSQAPCPDVHPGFNSPLKTLLRAVPKRLQCAVCSEPEICRVVMTPHVRKCVSEIVQGEPNAETGGILIGFVDAENQAIILRATGPGPKAIKSEGGFLKDLEYTQSELDRASRELGVRGQYVGEWHSHLVAEPEPSPLDMDSLFGIAAAPNYLMRCPVMIIAGFDRSHGRLGGIGAWLFPIGGRMYPTELAIVPEEDVNALRPRGSE